MSCDNSLVSLYNSTGNLEEYQAANHNILLPSIFAIICFLGIIGNCTVIYTIAKKTKFCVCQTVPDIFIFSLSVVDLLFLLGMPFLIHQLLGDGSWLFGATMCTVITALDSNSQIVSTYILTVMTLDRYLATVHPIRFSRVRTPRLAASAVGLVWFASPLTVAPVWLYAGLMPLQNGSVGCALLLPDPARDTYWFTLYQFILAFALPLAIISVAFFRILRSLSSAVAPLPVWSLRARTRKVTRTAIAVCLAFFICWAPYHALQLAHLVVQKPGRTFLYAYHVAISLGYANSCVNPFLYVALSKTFRRRLVAAMQRTRRGTRGLRIHPAVGAVDGSLCLQLAPDTTQQSRSSRELLHNMLPLTVAVP